MVAIILQFKYLHIEPKNFAYFLTEILFLSGIIDFPIFTILDYKNIHILKKVLFCITNEVKSNLGMPDFTVVSKMFWKL